MTVYFVRHASAGSRGSTSGRDDLSRQLDEVGQEQARGLIKLLGPSGVTEVYSSSATRCVETVTPLAEHLDLDVQIDPGLVEGQSATMAVHLVRTLASQGTTAVLCSHGDIIPDSIQTLAREGMVIVGPRGWAQGSTWELRTRGGDITEAEFLGPF